jgi:hypothetical protein
MTMVLLRLLAGLMGGAACVLALAGACGGSEFTSDGAGGSGNDGGGPPGSGGCGAPEDCPGQDLQCAKRSCEAGACGITNLPLGDATAEQYAGDCKTVRCNGQGASLVEPDETDTFDDGNECTEDRCQAGVPTNEATPGAACSLRSRGAGVCSAAAICVECIVGGECVEVGDLCVEGHCVPASCKNDGKDGEESDIDCGGPDCLPCDDLKACATDSDCVSGVCDGLVCQVPTCRDDVHNGAETGVDCGGAASTCKACPAGQPCGAPSDCVSQVCIGGKCKVPTCLDGVTNGQETDQDCGGILCMGCPMGLGCIKDGDCQSGYCDETSVCADRCQNDVRDGAETDVDCGGPSCAPCGLDARCLCNTDCQSQICCIDVGSDVDDAGTCVADIPSCNGSPVNICSIN